MCIPSGAWGCDRSASVKSISEIIEALRAPAIGRDSQGSRKIDEVRSQFVPPTLHLDVISEAFAGLDGEARLEMLSGLLSDAGLVERGTLDQVVARLPVTICPLTRSEASSKSSWLAQSTRATWVSSFNDEAKWNKSHESDVPYRFVHFYGYKGGQGRSTLLALLAKALADDGYKVLAIDADIEAPSLDLLLGASADSFAQTIMGLCGWSDEFRPIAGAYSVRSGGRVDLLPCRPRTENADLDFALLVATAPLDGRIYERAATRMLRLLDAQADKYDVVLLDHRTGIASSVLPLMARLPGSAVVFARTDFNTASVPSELRRVVRSIFSSATSIPGAFVSFSLDPNKAAAAERSSVEARLREQLLGELADVMEANARDAHDDQFVAPDLSLNWIDWYHDRALLDSMLPNVEKLQSDNKGSLRLLRESLALPLGRKQARHAVRAIDLSRSVATSLSGAKDAGQFIHIPEIENLFAEGNPYSYILGRKGTGKTRLLRELSASGLGTPILVAADEEGTAALQSKSIECEAWLEACEYDASRFWWSLLHMAIENPADASTKKALTAHLSNGIDPKYVADRLRIKSSVIQLASPRVFLVDGLETLVRAASIKNFVAALFEMMGTIQNDTSLASRLTIRAFVREDLAADSTQNVEQQMEGRNIRLKWSAASILNFAVSRLPTLSWISSAFKGVCEDISRSWSSVERGSLSEQDSTEYLLRIFPARLRRNNLSTATFLRLYFSDAGGDETNKATFYPRLYLSFLKKLDDLAGKSTAPIDEDGHISSNLLNRAYDDASGEFINETKQELSHLLSLESEGDDVADDNTKVAKFLAAFSGLSTPFVLEELVENLRAKTGFSGKSVRESLQRMKSVRMFEDRPGYAGWWRVGQLYKMGLNMKYVRV